MTSVPGVELRQQLRQRFEDERVIVDDENVHGVLPELVSATPRVIADAAASRSTATGADNVIRAAVMRAHLPEGTGRARATPRYPCVRVIRACVR